jgi:hypothetical protein
VVVTLTATSTNPGCAGTSVTWTPKAWTGAPSSPSNVFTSIPLTTTTPINPACSLAFVNQPTSGLAGANVTGADGQPVAVALLKPDGHPDTTYAGTISLALNATSGTPGATLTGGSGVPVDASGKAVFPALSIDQPGTGYQLVAHASAGGYADAASSPFMVFSGRLGCNDAASGPTGVTNVPLDATMDAAYFGSPGWALVRGPNWDGNANCVPVDYSFNLDAATNKATFLWDKSTGQKGAFKYVILWSSFPVDSGGSTPPAVAPAGWSSVRPYVSWGKDNPVPGTSDFVPALVCVGDDLAQGQALLPTIPDVWPFNDPAALPQYQPFDGNHQPQKAKVCIVQTGFTTMGVDPVTGSVKVQYWDKVIDEADAVIIRNP